MEHDPVGEPHPMYASHLHDQVTPSYPNTVLTGQVICPPGGCKLNSPGLGGRCLRVKRLVTPSSAQSLIRYGGTRKRTSGTRQGKNRNSPVMNCLAIGGRAERGGLVRTCTWRRLVPPKTSPRPAPPCPTIGG